MSSPVTTIAEIGKHEGQPVTLRGWLYNLRESGKLLFPQFRDGSGVIQGVVPKNAVTPEVFEAIKTLTQESSVIVEGKVRADQRAPGGYELDVIHVRVIQRVPESDPYPITPKEHGTCLLYTSFELSVEHSSSHRLAISSRASGDYGSCRQRGARQRRAE